MKPLDRLRAFLEDRRRLKLRIIEGFPIEGAEEVERRMDAEFNDLTQINEALRRIQRGRYGVCDQCDGAIDERRLELLPLAPLCDDCEERAEAA